MVQVKLTSDQVAALLEYARFRHGMACRIEFSLGWGCTVVEFHARDMDLLGMPLEEIVV